MVGVPGRSRGCHTCRRRKVKCDEAKPLCNRCEKAGLECEGYSKQAIYVHTTADGVLVAKPPAKIVPSQLRRKIPIKEIELTHVWRHRIEEYFLEKYLVVDHSSRNPSPGSYVLEAISAVPRDALLEAAIEALCLSRVGRMTGDDRLLHRGYQSYGIALQRLDTSVANTSSIIKDSTCAAAKIMNLHEFYEPSYNTGEAVYVHTIGIETILERRGPGGFTTKPMQALLKASRYNSMITMIKGRSFQSPLTDSKWKGILQDGMDGIEYALYDLGFDIAKLMQSLDLHINLKHEVNHTDNGVASQELMKECCNIHENLMGWYTNFLAQSPSPLYWHDGQPSCCFKDIPPLRFPHVIIAHIVTDYWALNILLGRAVGKLVELVAPSQQHDEKLLLQFNELAASHCNNTQVLHALKIMASVDYCSTVEAGLAGRDHMFALDVSLNLFRTRPGSYSRKLEAKTAEILNSLASGGLRFGESLVRPSLAGDWSRLM